MQMVTGCEPDVAAVERNTGHLFGVGERAVYLDDFSG